jgi:hypothetical protein
MGNMEKYINICRMSFVAENGLAHLCVCVIVLLSLFMFLLFLLGLIVAVVEGGGCGRGLSELRMSICKMGHLSIFVVKG